MFSYFDAVNGYPNNAYCYEFFHPVVLSNIAFWFQTFHIEEAYDNVTVQNVVYYDTIKIFPGRTYVSQTGIHLFGFNSDGAIIQAGFEVLIQEYVCLNQYYNVTIPCSGTKNVTYLESLINPHVFCLGDRIKINLEVEDKCPNGTDWVNIYYDIGPTSMISATISRSMTLLNFTRMVVYGDFYVEVHVQSSDYIVDTTDMSFLLTVSRISEPKLNASLVLNETTTYAFYDLTMIEDNSYIIIVNELPEDQIIDYFFVTNSTYGLFDVYEGFFEIHISPVGNIIKSCVNFKGRQFMPKGCILSSRDNLIYAEEQDKNHKVLMFARIRHLETKSCLFEHNVIDTKLLSEVNGTLTMTNNGTGGPCPVYLLNPFRNGRIYLDNIWTNSATHPIEIYNERDLVLNFTKFDKIGRFSLEAIFYRIIVPQGASFTAVAYDTEQHSTRSTVTSKCPDGTYEIPLSIRGKWRCLLFYQHNHVFYDAETICKQNNGHLISVKNRCLNQHITELLHSLNGYGKYWIGVRSNVSSVWTNVDDGTNITFSNWADKYPKSDNNLACVIIGDDEFWRNTNCDETHYFLCGILDEEGETGTGSVIRP